MQLVEQLALITPFAAPSSRRLHADSDQTTQSLFGRHLNAFIDSIDPQPTLDD